MTFGQASGPPATHRQVQQLLGLLNDAGHVDFRDARGPMDFTQRQAGGKFTRDEADSLIAQLEAEAEAEGGGAEVDGTVQAQPIERLSASDRALRKFTAPQLAAELQRRGWVVLEP